MPEFKLPFSGFKNNSKLTDEEFIRAIRLMVATEYEVIQLYTQIAELTDNKRVAQVLQEIADEENSHLEEVVLFALYPREDIRAEAENN